MNGGLTTALKAAAKIITMLKESFGYLAEKIEDVIDWLKKLADKWNAMKPPSWITGNSLPPLVDWFTYVAGSVQDTTKAMGNYDKAMGGMTAPAMGGIGTNGGLLAGIGQTKKIHLHYP